MEQKETRAQVWNGPMTTHAVATSPEEPIQFQTSWTLRSCLSLGEIAVSIWTGVGKLESISTCQWITKNCAVPWSKLPQLVVSQLSTGLFYFSGDRFLSTHDHSITCQWFECFCDEHSAFWLRLTSYFVFRIAITSLQWQQLKQCAPDARVRDIVLLIVTYPSSAAVSTARLRVTLPRSVRSCDTVLTANARVIPIATVPSYWRKEPRHERQMIQRVRRLRPAMVSLVWAQLQHGHHHLPRNSSGSAGLNHRSLGCKPWLKMKKNRHARSRKKLREIAALEARLAEGETLEDLQQKKVDKKSEFEDCEVMRKLRSGYRRCELPAKSLIEAK